MNRTISLISVLLITLSICPAVRASAWGDIAIEASRAEREKRLVESQQLWGQALVEAEKLGKDHPFYTITLRNLGYLNNCGWMGLRPDPERAESCFREELSILGKLSPTYPDLVFDLTMLADLDARKGKFQKALAEYEYALKIMEKDTTSFDKMREIYLRIQIPLYALNRKEEANQYLERLLVNEEKKRPKPSRLALADRFNFFGDVVGCDHPTNEYKKAFLEPAIAVRSSALKFVAGNSPDERFMRARILNRRMRGLEELERYDAALEDGLAALALMQSFPESERIMPELLFGVARNLHFRERFAEADRYAQRATLLIARYGNPNEGELRDLPNFVRVNKKAMVERQKFATIGAGSKPKVKSMTR